MLILKQLLISILIAIACVGNSYAISHGKMTPTKKTSIIGKWKGSLKGPEGKILGKAYMGSKANTSVLHTWTGKNNQEHCRYPLRRIEVLKDKSVLYKEESKSPKCHAMMVRIKRIGLKYVELTRFEMESGKEMWKGDMRMKKR